MAAHHTTGSVAVSIACLVAVALLSIPAGYKLVAKLRAKKDQYQHVSSRYEDKDGVATEESEEAFSDLIPRLLLILISIVLVSTL